MLMCQSTMKKATHNSIYGYRVLKMVAAIKFCLLNQSIHLYKLYPPEFLSSEKCYHLNRVFWSSDFCSCSRNTLSSCTGNIVNVAPPYLEFIWFLDDHLQFDMISQHWTAHFSYAAFLFIFSCQRLFFHFFVFLLFLWRNKTGDTNS